MCVFTRGQEAALCYISVFAYCLLACLRIGAFTLHRTKAMFTITPDFICLMHCHGCRVGQVLLVIKCMCRAATSFFFFFSRAGDGSDGEEVEEEDARILSGFLLAWGTAVALCVSYSLHSRKTISTVSSGECFVRSCYGLRCISGTLFLNRKRRWE